MSDNGSSNNSGWAARAALDWGDRKHAWALQAADSELVEQGELAATPEAVETWAASLAERFAGRPVAVVLEQSRGALFYMLNRYEHLVLHPMHPTSLAQYRKTMSPSGAKDDGPDARLLLDFLTHHPDRLRRWEPDTALTRTIQFMVEDRRLLVDEGTRQTHRLRDRLKLYFPQLVHWFAKELDSPLVGAFLLRWPTLAELQKARPETVRGFMHEHNSRSEERIAKLLDQIAAARTATSDQAVLQAGVAFVKILVQQIAGLRRGIAELNRALDELVDQHQDVALYRSLPGAGSVMEARLLAAMGTRRERYGSAGEIQCFSGIAPVLQRSGRRQSVHFRRACPKFLRQTFHEWASHTIGSSDWAKQYYDHKRSQGQSHQAAVRALAFKWIRILYRCWKDRLPYNEARDQQTLLRRAAPRQPNVPLKFAWKRDSGGFFRFAGGTTS